MTGELSRKYNENLKKILVLSNICWNFEEEIRGIFVKNWGNFWNIWENVNEIWVNYE